MNSTTENQITPSRIMEVGMEFGLPKPYLTLLKWGCLPI